MTETPETTPAATSGERAAGDLSDENAAFIKSLGWDIDEIEAKIFRAILVFPNGCPSGITFADIWEKRPFFLSRKPQAPGSPADALSEQPRSLSQTPSERDEGLEEKVEAIRLEGDAVNLSLDAWRELCNKDDRTSPEEYPEMCLITFDELKDFMARSSRLRRALIGTPPNPASESGKPSGHASGLRPAASEAYADRPYVLLKRGLFYRWNNRGYTSSIHEAGRYTKEQAEEYSRDREDQVTMRLDSDFAPPSVAHGTETSERGQMKPRDGGWTMFEKQKKALSDERNANFLILLIGIPIVLFIGAFALSFAPS